MTAISMLGGILVTTTHNRVLHGWYQEIKNLYNFICEGLVYDYYFEKQTGLCLKLIVMVLYI